MNGLRNIIFLGLIGLLPVSVTHSAEVGEQLNTCPLTEFSKSHLPLNLQEYKGKVLYLDFWASWCPPCAKSFPFINQLHQQYQSQGLQVLGINLDESTEEAEQFLSKYPAEFTIVSDLSKHCAENIGVAAMPSTYLIDRKGVIRYIHLGFRASETAELRAKVEQLLAEPEL